MTDIRIFCGTEAKTRVPELVLKHSIASRTDRDVQFVAMGDNEPWLVPDDVHQATGFSLRRWMIPEYCGYRGRAIYLDADQICLRDIEELWRYGDGDGVVFCAYRPDKTSPDKPVPQTSVMVINCDRCDPAQWSRDNLFEAIRTAGPPRSPEAIETYQWIMHGYWVEPPPVEIPSYWNEFNELHEDTRLVHYTSEDRQPWYKPGHTLRQEWERELVAAINAGIVESSDLIDALARWHEKPSDWRRFGGLHPYYKRFVEPVRRASDPR